MYVIHDKARIKYKIKIVSRLDKNLIFFFTLFHFITFIYGEWIFLLFSLHFFCVFFCTEKRKIFNRVSSVSGTSFIRTNQLFHSNDHTFSIDSLKITQLPCITYVKWFRDISLKHTHTHILSKWHKNHNVPWFVQHRDKR